MHQATCYPMPHYTMSTLNRSQSQPSISFAANLGLQVKRGHESGICHCPHLHHPIAAARLQKMGK